MADPIVKVRRSEHQRTLQLYCCCHTAAELMSVSEVGSVTTRATLVQRLFVVVLVVLMMLMMTLVRVPHPDGHMY